MALDSGRRDDLDFRMTRAIRLDPAVYREVAVASTSTRQAAVVVAIVAAASSLSWGVHAIPALVPAEPGAAFDGGRVIAQLAHPIIGLCAIAHVCAWLTWTAGLWIVGARIATPAGSSCTYWGLARALAFAQAPAVFRLATVLLVAGIASVFGADGLRTSFARTLTWIVETGIEVWVLVATFVAIREAMRLSNGAALGSLVLVGLTLSGLVSFSVVALVIASGQDALDPGTFQHLPRNMAEFGTLAVGGLLVLFGCFLVVRWLRESERGCLMAALLVPAGLAIAVLLGLNYLSSDWTTPGILGFVVPRNNVAEFTALVVTGLWLIFWSLFILRGWLRLDSVWTLVPVGVVVVVLLGLGVTALALVETTIPEVVGSRTDFPAAPAIAAGFDFNLDLGVVHSEWLVNALSGAVLDTG